ncbi:hypothetical protein SUDANB176_07351 [Streptomyces sp. enrichment culture]
MSATPAGAASPTSRVHLQQRPSEAPARDLAPGEGSVVFRPCPTWWWLVGLVMGRGTWSWIVPDGLWEIAKPLIPPSRVRPQGGGTQDTPDETLFAANIYVLVSGCAWRALPPCFGIPKSTAHRRFLIWPRAGLRGRLHEAVLHQLDNADLVDVTRVVLDTAHVRTKKRGRTHRSEPRGPGQERDTTPAAAAASSPSGCTRTRPTTASTCADGSGASASACASPTRASSPVNDQGGVAGSSSGPRPGRPVTAGSAPATSAIPATTWPFSASPPPCAAPRDFSASPHRTRS